MTYVIVVLMTALLVHVGWRFKAHGQLDHHGHLGCGPARGCPSLLREQRRPPPFPIEAARDEEQVVLCLPYGRVAAHLDAPPGPHPTEHTPRLAWGAHQSRPIDDRLARDDDGLRALHDVADHRPGVVHRRVVLGLPPELPP